MNFDQRVRADADAISRHQSEVKRIKADPKRMQKALKDYFANRGGPSEWEILADLCAAAVTDEAEAGREIASMGNDAAHESARVWLGDDAEVIEPTKPEPFDIHKLATDIFNLPKPLLPRPLQDRVDGARGIKK